VVVGNDKEALSCAHRQRRIDLVLSHRHMQSSRCYIVTGQQRDCHCRRRRVSDPRRQLKIEQAEGRACSRRQLGH